MRKLLSLLLCSVAHSAFAQDIPLNSIAVGAGPGAVGFRFIGPCGTGQVPMWTGGPTAPPACGSAGGAGSITVAGTPPITSTLNLPGDTWTVALTTPLTTTFGGTGLTAPAAGAAVFQGGATAMATRVMGAGQLLIGQAAGPPLALNIKGDATLAADGTLTVTGGGGGGDGVQVLPVENLYVIGATKGAISGPGRNVALGFLALDSCTTCSDTVAIGRGAATAFIGGSDVTGTGNTIVGAGAFPNVTQVAANNIVIGHNALSGANTLGGLDNNIIIGASSGLALTNGDANIMIGFNTGGVLTTGSGNVIIGGGIPLAGGNINNTIMLGTGGTAPSGGPFTPGVVRLTINSTGQLILDAYDTAGCLEITSGGLVTSTGVDCGTGGGGGSGVTNVATGNTFAGTSAGAPTLVGDFNTAFGTNALTAVTTSVGNTAVGYNALSRITIASGPGSVPDGSDYNTAVGVGAGELEARGLGANVYVGREAGNNNRDGHSQVMLGHRAGFRHLGRGASLKVTATTLPTDGDTISIPFFIGTTSNARTYTFRTTVKAANDVRIGTGTFPINDSIANLICAVEIGWAANGCVEGVDYFNFPDPDAANVKHPDVRIRHDIPANSSSAFIVYAVTANPSISATQLTVATTGGWANVTTATPLERGDVTTGSNNTFIGDQAGFGSSDSNYNVMIGLFAGQWHDSGDENVCIGATACLGLTSGFDNVAIGANAMGGTYNPVGGVAGRTGFKVLSNNSTAVGWNANRYVTTGANNVSLGSHALLGDPVTPLTGTHNVAIGNSALIEAVGSAASNTSVGSASLASLTTGDANTAMGRWGGSSITTGSNNIHIGHCNAIAQCPGNTTGSGNVVIGGNVTVVPDAAANNVYIANGIGQVKLETDSVNDALSLYSGRTILWRKTDPAEGARLDFFADNLSVAAGHLVGDTYYTSRALNDEPVAYARFAVQIGAPKTTAASADGSALLTWHTLQGGLLKEALIFQDGAMGPAPDVTTSSLGTATSGWHNLHLRANAPLNWGNGQVVLTPFTTLGVLNVTTNDTAANRPNLRLISTSTATVGPWLTLWQNRAIPANNDTLGVLAFQGNDNLGAQNITYANIVATATNITSTTKAASLQFFTYAANANAERMAMTDGVTIPATSYLKVDGKIRAGGGGATLGTCTGNTGASVGVVGTSTAQAGFLNMGTTAITACTVNFTVPYAVAPICVISPVTAAGAATGVALWAVSATSGLTVNVSPATALVQVQYMCMATSAG